MSTTRILCLHGYHGSAAILRQQIAPVAAALAPSNWSSSMRRPWRQVTSAGGTTGFAGGNVPATGSSICLLRNDSTKSSASVRALRSRGCWRRCVIRSSALISFDLAIMVGGFTSTAPQHAQLLVQKLRVPSLHVMGRYDRIVPMRDLLLLADRFAQPVVIEHGGGHVIPDDPAITQRIAAFVADRGKVTSPK